MASGQPSELRDRALYWLWGRDTASLALWERGLVRALRLVYAVIRDLLGGQLNLQAMSLVYTTLLSLVPLLAVSFSVLKAFGVHNQVEPLLLNFLQPLGAKGAELADTIIGFVENVKVGVLGALGLAVLFYTVISLIQKIEHAFNATWHVKRLRPLSQRFSDYLSVLLIGPVLVFSAIGTTASIMGTELVQDIVAIEPFGVLVESGAKLVPYFFIIAAFTFVYIFVPNTRVRFVSALVGALVAGVLWQSVGWAVASFVVTSTRYTAIYSGFAIVVVFMIWLYLAWLILLVGASIAFYHQHPEYLSSRRREMHPSARLKERLALLAMYLVGDSHFREHPAWTAEALGSRLAVPTEVMEGILDALVARGFLAATSAEPPAYVPRRAPENVSVREVLAAVRTAEEDPYLNLDRLHSVDNVDHLVGEIEQALATTLETRTVRDLVLGEAGHTAADEQASTAR